MDRAEKLFAREEGKMPEKGKGRGSDEWQEIGGQGAILVLNDENTEVEGTLTGIRPSDMYPENKLYDMDTPDGPVAVAGCSAINARINDSHVGAYLRIKFAGMAKGKSGRTYKDFQISVRAKAAPMKAEDSLINEPPF